jgi:glutamate carboxypeptidase
MKFQALSLLSSVALFALSTPAFAQLSKPEAKIAATVDAEYERSVALLERMVNQNSGTMNFAGVKTVGDMMRAELEPLGFKVEWLDMAKAGRAGHLVATKAGKKGTKKLLLIAHLDTVFEADSPFQKFVRRGDQAVGPGAGDDKGGMVVMGRPVGPTRPPLPTATKERQAYIAKQLEELGIMDTEPHGW